jgi:RNA recognition motif-containing protein
MSSNKLYVGGLPYSTSDMQLEDLFSAYGTVESVRIITDRMTGRSRGFGFVEMSTPEEADEATQQLNGTEYGGRTLVVNEAKPRENRRPGGGRRDGGGRGGFGGGGGRDRW